MNDADVELRIADWLHADAAGWQAPGSLRRRVLDLPARPAPRASLWHRFAGLPAMSGAVVAVGLVAVLVANSFFGLFDRPAGTDGGQCNNRQVQRALDALRDADGYRYVSREERRALDPDAEVDFDNPAFVWEVTWVSDGAHLAPDRAHDVPRSQAYADVRGYLEHLQLGGHTYQLREAGGEAVWVEQENWPTANWVWGYLANQFPIFSIPGVNALAWDAAVPDDLPGAGGCVAAARLPDDYGMPGRIAALRVDTASGRPVTTFIGPAVDARGNEGETRSTWEITWELPSPDEFVAPDDPQPDPNEVGSTETPPPTPTPIPVADGAWQPVALPLTPALEDATGVSISRVVHGDRWVAVGSAYDADGSLPAIWTSQDGVTWEAVEGLAEMGDFSPSGIGWDGREYLLIGYREHPTEEPAWDSFRPESWISSDGVTWEPGGEIGPAMGSGDLANVETPVAAGPGWVAGGSIFTQVETGQEYRPAFFWSEDGREWTTVELAGTRTGQVRSPIVLPDGSLLSLGCESPSAASTGSGDCYVRPWHSEDGIAWAPGPIIEADIGSTAVWDGRVVGLVATEEPTDPWPLGGALVVSDDGESWEPFAELPSDASPGGIRVTDTTLIVEASVPTAGGTSRGIVWRYGTDGTWERFDLAPPTEGAGLYLGGAIDSERGLLILGSTSDLETGAGAAYVWIEP